MSRGRHPVSKQKSPVVQSAHLGDDVISRLQQTQQGLRPALQGSFVDLTAYDPDRYLESLNMVATMKQTFNSFPSGLRAACLNDPRQLLVLGQKAAQGDDLSVAILKKYGLSVTPPKAPETPAAKEGSGDGTIPLD